jgi:hypothetical protein
VAAQLNGTNAFIDYYFKELAGASGCSGLLVS